ncbi:MAG TPA: hypothetical protein VF543_21670 [Pyrinomonadaceae bacterium]|jgi:hypothetical protein
MRKIHLSLLLSLVAFFATGCPQEPSKSFNNKNSFVSNVNEYLAAAQGRYEQNVKANPDEAKRIRNDALEDAVAVINSNYTEYITRLNTRRSTADFIADVIELGTSATTGIVKGERPNQILGIALTAFRGGRRSSELNFYKEQTVPLLITKMDDNRAQIYALILTKKGEPVTNYSMKEAIKDIVDYYNAGTLIRAFTQLQKDVGAQAQKSENRVLALQGFEVTPEATVETRDLSVGARRILERLRNDLKDPAKSAAAVTTLQSIVAALEADDDAKKALEDAGVSSSDTDGVKLRNALVVIRRKAAKENNAGLLDKINQAIVDNEQ